MNRVQPVLILSSIFLLAQGPCDSADQDEDGYTTSDGDCNDTDASIHPGAAELCDGVDTDCDAATSDNCTRVGFDYTYRASTVSASGEDNGRVEPASYDHSVITLGLDSFAEKVAGQLEYVNSSASQVSSISPLIIDASGTASAGGADDYGYGMGASVGTSTFTVTFALEQRAILSASWLLTESTCTDPATVDAFLNLSDENVEYLAVSGTEEFGAQLELEPGEYTLLLAASASNEMSGGGDAYPCGEATYQFFAQIMN